MGSVCNRPDFFRLSSDSSRGDMDDMGGILEIMPFPDPVLGSDGDAIPFAFNDDVVFIPYVEAAGGTFPVSSPLKRSPIAIFEFEDGFRYGCIPASINWLTG